ncbi:MAG: ATP phosphoribosyltransferase regulatory subunit [Hyphomicrobiales bacterium]|nr:ATP phosphoribosyltransferase regulatory subunit [Hyphomicrobiales bacterium]
MSSMPTNSDLRAQKLISSFVRAGYGLIDPPVVQPAEPFLDLSGEDIRRRMFLTSDPHGRELCLRPDLTIPVSREYLASPAAGKAMSYCYLGTVFRHREGLAAEFVQAGIESFARTDKAAADAEMLALGLEATTLYGLANPEIRIGDVGLFSAFVAALDLPPPWKRRLVKDFNRKWSLAHDLDQLAMSGGHAPPEYQGLLAALAGSDPKAARHLVTDLLSIAGIEAVGGRSVAEIAERFLEQAALGGGTRLPHEIRALIERFLAVRGEPDQAADELRTLTADARISLDPALDLLETRTGFLAARGVDVSRLQFATAFGRGFDYYTGFVFELHDPGVKGPLIAGGRYDGLLARLGAREAIPAVGFAASIEELAACGGQP